MYINVMNFIAENFAMLVGIVFMLVILSNDSSLDKEKKHFFYIAYILSVIAFGADIFEAIASTRTSYEIPRVVWTAMSYSIRPVLVYLFLIIGHHSKERKTTEIILFIPAVVNSVVAFSALFCHVSFYYTESNSFMRGPLGYMPVYTLVFYFLTVIVYEIKMSYKDNPHQIINVSACVLICAAALIVQIQTGNASVGRIAHVYAMMLYYMFFQSKLYQIQNAKEKFKAEHDALTGLMNREAFNRYTDKYYNSNDAILLLLIDIDMFKTINDTYGHETGDYTLIRVSQLLKNTFRKSDYIFRIGGDEFAIIITLPEDTFITKEITKKLSEINKQLLDKDNDLPPVSISTGISFSDAGYTKKLFEQSDRALYHTKNTLRGGCTVYSDSDTLISFSETNNNSKCVSE